MSRAPHHESPDGIYRKCSSPGNCQFGTASQDHVELSPKEAESKNEKVYEEKMSGEGVGVVQTMKRADDSPDSTELDGALRTLESQIKDPDAIRPHDRAFAEATQDFEDKAAEIATKPGGKRRLQEILNDYPMDPSKDIRTGKNRVNAAVSHAVREAFRTPEPSKEERLDKELVDRTAGEMNNIMDDVEQRSTSPKMTEDIVAEHSRRIVDTIGSDLSAEDKDSIAHSALQAYRGRMKFGGGSREDGAESAATVAVNTTYMENRRAAEKASQDSAAGTAGDGYTVGSGDSAGNTDSSDASYDTTKPHYGEHMMISLDSTLANNSQGLDAKKVKSNERRAVSIADNGDDAPDLPVVKKRKSSKTGYRDTTVYSSDGKRFVTIRANEDTPEYSYYIDGSEEGEPTQHGLYRGADSAVARLDDYSREVSGSEKSHRVKTAEAKQNLARSSAPRKITRDNLQQVSDDEYERTTSDIKKIVSRHSGDYDVNVDDVPTKDESANGTERRIRVRPKNGGEPIVFRQLTTEKNIDGDPDVFYDVSSGEFADQPGIYMKGDTREDKLRVLNNLLSQQSKK